MPTPRSGYIYLVTNMVNGKKYVGQTRFTVSGRWKQHVDAAGDGSRFALHCAIRKHGAINFTIQEIANVGHDSINATEKHCIELFETYALTGHGYNMTFGGDGTSGWRNPPTDEWRRKQREAHLGKKLSDAHRESLRRSHIGRIYSKRGPETGEKIRARLLGGKLSDETKRRMSEKRRGRPQGPHSEETKKKLSDARKLWLEKRRVL